jgi:SPP1 family predicted phage head-tail adaptor
MGRILMGIGDLKHRIVLQYQAKVADGMGGFVVTWVPDATVWAAIWPVSAGETIQADQTTMTITHRIRIRYRDGLKAAYRIAWAGRYFNIVSIIDPNMAHRWMDVLCKEVA